MKWEIFYFIVCIMSFCSVLISLNIINYNGRLKFEIKGNKRLPIGWIIMLIFSIVMVIMGIIFIKVLQKNSYTLQDLNFLSLGFIWIGLSISHIITDRIYFQVREKGVFINKNFYRWKKLKNYKWLESDILQFQVRRAYNKMDKYVEIKIDSQYKQIVDSQLNKYKNVLCKS